jgi:hypothetical protein
MGVELGGWSAGGVTAESGVSLLTVEEIVAGVREGEIRNRVRSLGLDRRRPVGVTEDAVDVVELAVPGVAVRDGDGEQKRRGEKRGCNDPFTR